MCPLSPAGRSDDDLATPKRQMFTSGRPRHELGEAAITIGQPPQRNESTANGPPGLGTDGGPSSAPGLGDG